MLGFITFFIIMSLVVIFVAPNAFFTDKQMYRIQEFINKTDAKIDKFVNKIRNLFHK